MLTHMKIYFEHFNIGFRVIQVKNTRALRKYTIIYFFT